MPIPVVEELKALIPDQPKNPLRPAQMRTFTEERDRQVAMASAPTYVTGHDRGAAAARARELAAGKVRALEKEIARLPGREASGAFRDYLFAFSSRAR